MANKQPVEVVGRKPAPSQQKDVSSDDIGDAIERMQQELRKDDLKRNFRCSSTIQNLTRLNVLDVVLTKTLKHFKWIIQKVMVLLTEENILIDLERVSLYGFAKLDGQKAGGFCVPIVNAL